MDNGSVARWTRTLSRIALGLAVCQLIVAIGVAVLPPPESSEGGPIAGVFYAAYYAAPLTLLGLALRSRARWIMALVALLAFGLVILHSAPLLTFQLTAGELPWQRILGVVLSALSGLVEAAVFVVAVAALLAGGPRQEPAHRALD